MEGKVIGGGNVHSSHLRVLHFGSTSSPRSSNFEITGIQCRKIFKYDSLRINTLPKGLGRR